MNTSLCLVSDLWCQNKVTKLSKGHYMGMWMKKVGKTSNFPSASAKMSRSGKKKFSQHLCFYLQLLLSYIKFISSVLITMQVLVKQVLCIPTEHHS